MNSRIEESTSSGIHFTLEDLQVLKSIQEAATADLILPFPDYLFEGEEDVSSIHTHVEVDEVLEKYVYPR